MAVSPTTRFVRVHVQGETFFRIARWYGISLAEIYQWNPHLSEGMKSSGNETLLVPIKVMLPETDSLHHTYYEGGTWGEGASLFLVYHYLQAGETLFQLSQRYRVPISLLETLNPSLELMDLEVGQKIVIPILTAGGTDNMHSGEYKPFDDHFSDKGGTVTWDSVFSTSSEQNAFIPGFSQRAFPELSLPFLKSNKRETVTTSEINVGLLMPLSLDRIDSLRKNKAKHPLPAMTKHMYDFYHGFLLAADMLSAQGVKVNIHVKDTRRDASVVSQMLRQDRLVGLDLLVGPFFSSCIYALEDYAAQNNLPVITPFTDYINGAEGVPLIFPVPTVQHKMSAISRLLMSQGKDVQIICYYDEEVKEGTGWPLIDYLKKEMIRSEHLAPGSKLRFREVNQDKHGVLGLARVLDSVKLNVIIIPSFNRVAANDLLSKAYSLRDQAYIKVIGMPGWSIGGSSSISYFHALEMTCPEVFYVDMEDPTVCEFLRIYRQRYNNEWASPFSYQGFDIGYYFLSAWLEYGKEMFKNLPDYPMRLLQSRFQFYRNKKGWLVNTSFFIMNYSKRFEVTPHGILETY